MLTNYTLGLCLGFLVLIALVGCSAISKKPNQKISLNTKNLESSLSRLVEDERMNKIAEAYSLDAQDHAKKYFSITLDFSDNSIKLVENILDHLHKTSMKEKPTDEREWEFAKVYGCYLGEVFRHNHGAGWLEDGTMKLGDGYVWPIARAHKRITNGEEDNAWHYLQILTKEKQ